MDSEVSESGRTHEVLEGFLAYWELRAEHVQGELLGNPEKCQKPFSNHLWNFREVILIL